MDALTPRVTKRRMVAGLTFFLAAAGVMYVLGADMPSLLLGAGIGIVLIGAVAVSLWALDRRVPRASVERDEPSSAPLESDGPG